MKVSSALRTAAVGLALSVCALLLGLSHASHALPGDTFQVARTTSVTAAAPGAEATQGRKAPKAHDHSTVGHLWHATLPDGVVAGPALVPAAVAPLGAAIHCGLWLGELGGRDPPAS